MLSTSTNRIEYTGNGSQTVFPYNFRIFADADLQVYLVLISSGVETLQTLTTHYTVSGAGGAGGGNVIFLSAPSSLYRVLILRVIAATQSVDYVDHDSFPAETHEGALDRLTMLAQQLGEGLSRSIKLPTGAILKDVSLPDPNITTNQGKVVRIKSDGTGLEAVPMTGSGSITLPLGSADGGTGSSNGLSNIVYAADYANMAALLTAIGSASKTVYVLNAGFQANTTATAGANISWEFHGAGSIAVANGVTLVINGTLIAPRRSIFTLTGTGVVNFGAAVPILYPEWWGLVVGDSSGNEAADNIALTACFAAQQSNNAKVELPAGCIWYSAPLTFGLATAECPTLQGQGGGVWDAGAGVPVGNTILKFNGTGVALSLAARGTRLIGLQIVDAVATTSSNATAGLQLCTTVNQAGFLCRDVSINGFKKVGAAGMTIGGGRFVTSSNFEHCSYTNNYNGVAISGGCTTMRWWGCSFTANSNYGAYITNGESMEFFAPTFQSNTSYGLSADCSGGGVASPIHVYGGYFEANGTYNVFLKSGGPAPSARGRASSFVHCKGLNPGTVRVEDQTDIQIIGGSRSDGNYMQTGASPFSEGGSVNVGLIQYPFEYAQAAVANLEATLYSLFPTTLAGLWCSDIRTGVTMEDRSGNSRHAAMSFDATYNGVTPNNIMQAWVNSLPLHMVLSNTAYFDMADVDEWSMGTGAVDLARSVVVLMKNPAAASSTLMAKYDDAAKREWIFGVNGTGLLYAHVYDESANARIGRVSTSTAGSTTWSVYVMTKSTGTTNASIAFYLNGAQFDTTDQGSGVYVAAENLTAKLATYQTIGAAKSLFATDRRAVTMMLTEQLTAQKVYVLTNLLRGYAADINRIS